MKRRLITAVLLMTALIPYGCRSSSEKKSGGSDGVATPEVNEVETVTLHKEDFAHQIISNGKLKANRRTTLSFGTTGSISQLNIRTGSRIEAGHIAARLDRPDLKLTVEDAKLAMYRAEIELYDILAGLGHTARDTAEIPVDIMTMAKMRSGYTSARNNMKRAELEYAGTVLKAPFSGKIADLNVKLHDRVTSEPICTIIDDSSLEIEFHVMESEFASVSVGLPVTVKPFADQTRTYHGKISEINPVIDENGQILVRAVIRNDGSLIEGMNAKVIVERLIPGQLIVPRSAVVSRNGLDVVFKYEDDGKAHWTYVTIVSSNGDSFAITANKDRNATLDEGDRIIISGNLYLADKSDVRIKE